jgi:hypothetical protein
MVAAMDPGQHVEPVRFEQAAHPIGRFGGLGRLAAVQVGNEQGRGGAQRKAGQHRKRREQAPFFVGLAQQHQQQAQEADHQVAHRHQGLAGREPVPVVLLKAERNVQGTLEVSQ